MSEIIEAFKAGMDADTYTEIMNHADMLEVYSEDAPVLPSALDPIKAKVAGIVETVEAMAVDDDESLARAETTLKGIRSLFKQADELRKEIKRPYMEQAKVIDSLAGAHILDPLGAAIEKASKRILAYKTEQERIRQEEIRRVEAERRAREEAERRERERRDAIRARVDEIERRLRSRLSLSVYDPTGESPDDISRLILLLEISRDSILLSPSFTEAEQAEIAMLASPRLDSVLSAARQHREVLRSAYEQRMQALREAGDAEEKRRKLEEANAKAKEQQERLARQQELADKVKAEQDRRERELAEQKAELDRKAEQERLRKLEDERQKGLRSTWSYEVTDIGEVPREFLTVDDKAVKAALYENKKAVIDGSFTIPGIRFVRNVGLSGK